MKIFACAAALLLTLPVLLLTLVVPAAAQDGPLTGTLGKIRSSGKITLGVRDAALPFSYKLPNGTPAGYAVELCKEVVDDVSAELDGMKLPVAYTTVTADSRIGLVASGAVDIECGSTTRNKQRQQLVAFSPVFFVAGTKLLVSRESPIKSYRDLAGKTVVVTSGTTNETAMHALVDRLLLHVKIVAAPDHSQSFAMLRSGSVDAFATDDVLLAGLAATREGVDYHVVGEYLSYEPYGLMYRKDDPAFAAVVERGFKRMAESGRLSDLYDRWLMQRLPTGEMLNMPMSAELSEIFRVLGQPD
jgi:glutamate/aspartate transport system substrate-binding protein